MQTFKKLPMQAPMQKSQMNKSAGQTYTDMRSRPSDTKRQVVPRDRPDYHPWVLACFRRGASNRTATGRRLGAS